MDGKENLVVWKSVKPKDENGLKKKTLNESRWWLISLETLRCSRILTVES